MWRDQFRSIIIERAYDYFLEGRFDLIDLKEDYISATVHGTFDYIVKINFKDDNTIIKMTCDCPYAKEDNCKHMATILIYLDYLMIIANNKELISDIPHFKRDLLDSFLIHLINDDPLVGVRFIEYLKSLKIN